MIIAGIDPGSNLTGYAFLKKETNVIKVLEYGVVRTRPAKLLPYKLQIIYTSLCKLFNQYKPEEVALESVFVAKFPGSALVLGHTRGAVMVAATTCGIKISEYAPRIVKKSVVGIGRASKAQVTDMIQKHLHLAKKPVPNDSSDALAIAYCHMLRKGVL